MHFSIIIPTYNSAKYIGHCLESILQLDYPKENYEIILVDGGSNDNTVEIAHNFSGLKILKSNNSSISNSRNIGAYEAIARNLVFIDSDCIADKKLLKKAYQYLIDYECCGGFYRPHPSHGWVSKTWLRAENKNIGLVEWITAGTLVVRKKCFLEVGGFREDLQAGEDVEFGARLRRYKYKIFNDPSIGSIHLGQSDRLLDFFKKEMWRGKSIIMTIKKPNIKNIYEMAFNMMVLFYFSLYVLFFIMVLSRYLVLSCIVFLFLLITPLSLTIKKIIRMKTWSCIFQTFVLDFVYLSARSASIIYYNQFRNLFRQ
jgi:glycosyltransferase involved in cell wall biosynthesis